MEKLGTLTIPAHSSSECHFSPRNDVFASVKLWSEFLNVGCFGKMKTPRKRTKRKFINSYNLKQITMCGAPTCFVVDNNNGIENFGDNNNDSVRVLWALARNI